MANALSGREAFLEAVENAAQESQTRSGVPASVTVAQAILESDWGESQLAKVANNYFGIKATGKIGSGGVVWMRTWEVIGGEDAFLKEPFRAYRSLEDSVDDHANLFTGLRLYSGAMRVVEDPLSFAQAIHAAGYSTDPNYVSKLVRLMDQYDLGRLDHRDT
jgi:flagellum-specific peptidoglycan hydrolase FlgJ